MDPHPVKKPKLDEEERSPEEALVQYYTTEVDILKQKVTYFQSQLAIAEQKLTESRSNLARRRIRSQNPQITIDAHTNQDLIRNIRGCVTPNLLEFHNPSNQISSQHKRKLKCLVLNPVEDYLFATSALDGFINLWKIIPMEESTGIVVGASLIGSLDCLSASKRWPEDIAWHPDGNRLFAAYNGSQVSVLDFDLSKSKISKFCFLDEKPHSKGTINSISFLPWDQCFATGGTDHAVVIWNERDDGSWKPESIHRNQHSSSVMGVSGLSQKKMVLSVGLDKKIIGFDVVRQNCMFKHIVDSKCMSVLVNPAHSDLVMVQTGQAGKQLRLFDARMVIKEVHSLGWQQESSESQSSLINQSWSPDGWYLSSGSADPLIHIFDIRFSSQGPMQSLHAHQKRVFKAVWHKSLLMLTSISSDLNIGFHRII